FTVLPGIGYDSADAGFEGRGSMATVGSEARVTAPGDRTLGSLSGLPDISAGELPVTAWQVYETALAAAQQQNPTPIAREGVKGYRFVGAQKTLVLDYWPKLAGDDSMDAVTTAVNGYLRETGNMTIINRGSRVTPSEWFVRGEWNDQPPVRA